MQLDCVSCSKKKHLHFFQRTNSEPQSFTNYWTQILTTTLARLKQIIFRDSKTIFRDSKHSVNTSSKICSLFGYLILCKKKWLLVFAQDRHRIFFKSICQFKWQCEHFEVRFYYSVEMLSVSVCFFRILREKANFFWAVVSWVKIKYFLNTVCTKHLLTIFRKLLKKKPFFLALLWTHGTHLRT